MSASSSESSAHGLVPDLAEAAARLEAAARDRRPCDPVRTLVEPHGVAGAYAVQHALNAARERAGARVVGRKIGLTARAVQAQLGVDQPDYGLLFDDMACGDGEEIAHGGLLQPRVEAEVAFVMARALPEGRTALADVIGAVAYAVPALEVVDSRVRDWGISIHDTIADNASSGAFVLGGSPRKLDGLDLRLCGMSLLHRGEPVSLGCGAACLGHPLNAVAWLARTMAAVGRPLGEGDVVLSGALGPMVPALPGEVYEARIRGLGRVAAAFSGRGA